MQKIMYMHFVNCNEYKSFRSMVVSPQVVSSHIPGPFAALPRSFHTMLKSFRPMPKLFRPMLKSFRPKCINGHLLLRKVVLNILY